MKKYFVPLGRLQDYPHPAPDRTAVRFGKGMFSNVTCIIYPSREFMKNALRKQGDNEGQWALVKDNVPGNMLTCKFYERTGK